VYCKCNTYIKIYTQENVGDMRKILKAQQPSSNVAILDGT
jgi:hypothetical protein